MILVIVMNDNVAFACLLDELMLCCVCYCWHDCFFAIKFDFVFDFDEFNIWSNSDNGSVNL
jgi:hypothetical protein